MSDTLLDVYTAHCFLSLRGCEHTVSGIEPDEVHDRMERHYETTHRAWLDSIVDRQYHPGRKGAR